MTIWHAFRTAPQRELRAKDVLRRKGFDVFVPLERRFVGRRPQMRKGEPKVRHYPILLGYILIRFDGPVPWYELAETRIVKSVVGFDRDENGYLIPGAIGEAAIEHLMSRSAMPYNAPHSRRSFQAGELARVTDGHALAGHTIKVESVVGEQAKFYFELFNSKRAMTIGLDKLDVA